MDTKTKIFWWTMGVLILTSFGATFYRYMIKKDYIVQAQVDCDPYVEACFVWECDPESTEEGEMCTGDPEEDVWYYKIINKNASRISSCDANDENCDALVCAQNEPDCEFVFCNNENMEENYASACIDPTQYALENPIEEEEVKCEEGKECVEVDEEAPKEEELVEENAVTEDANAESNQPESAESVEDTNSAEKIENVNETNNEEPSSGDVSVDAGSEESSSQNEIVQNNDSSGGDLPIIE